MHQRQERTLNTPVHCILILELPRKIQQHSQALDGTVLCLHRKRERSASFVCLGPSGLASPSLTQADKGNGSYLLLSCLPPSAMGKNDPNPTPVDSEILKAGVCLEATATCLSRAKKHPLSLR